MNVYGRYMIIYTYSSWALWTNWTISWGAPPCRYFHNNKCCAIFRMSEGMPPCPASFRSIHVLYSVRKSEIPTGMWLDWIFPAQVEVREPDHVQVSCKRAWDHPRKIGISLWFHQSHGSVEDPRTNWMAFHRKITDLNGPFSSQPCLMTPEGNERKI